MNTVDLRALDRVTGQAETLDNGLRVVLLPRSGAESVVVALCYLAGSRDEASGEWGLAHFLEHMMFKGSAAYGPGAIDRLTQRLGGTNNAFTSHDATVYHFAFERGSWQEALRIEADRMRGLSLLPAEVELEREVILEEIRMAEDDPWDALEQAVATRLFGGHPYGRSVLGTKKSLRALDAAALRSFHCRHYRPDRAVLACAGGLPADAINRVEAAFGGVAAGSRGTGGERGERGDPAVGARFCAGWKTHAHEAAGGVDTPGGRALADATAPWSVRARSTAGGRSRVVAASAAPVPPVFDARRDRRIELRRGETARLLVAHPAPVPDDPAHVHLRLALAVLCSGRSSRVQRDLVEEEALALWASAAVSGHRLGGMATFSAETAPGVDPERLEEELLARVEGLASRPPNAEEVDRAKRILFADWVFLHESTAERAMTAALEQALFRPGFSRASFERLAAASASDVASVCASWLSEATRVTGWSLPARSSGVRAAGASRSVASPSHADLAASPAKGRRSTRCP